MSIATEFVIVGLETIDDRARRHDVADRLSAPGRDLIEVPHAQICAFAETIERSATIVALDIPTIELAGGSVRCMLAGIHLDLRERTSASEVAVGGAAGAPDGTSSGVSVPSCISSG